MERQNIIFSYTLKKDADKKIYGGFWGFIISNMYILLLLLALPFIVLSFTKDPKFFIFALLLLPFAYLFGPFARKMKTHYCVTYFENDTVLLKSTINFIPRTHTVNLKQISLIERENPMKAQALLFKDSGGRTLARFNHLLMGLDEFTQFTGLIKSRNKHIQLKTGT